VSPDGSSIYVRLGKRLGLTIRQLGYRRIQACLSNQSVMPGVNYLERRSR